MLGKLRLSDSLYLTNIQTNWLTNLTLEMLLIVPATNMYLWYMSKCLIQSISDIQASQGTKNSGDILCFPDIYIYMFDDIIL